MKPIHEVTILAAAAIVLFACDIPTEAPILEQRWILPVEETTLDVDELLPDNVDVEGSNFAVTVDPFTTSESLGNLCAACAPLNGTTAPVPAFAGSFMESQTLPPDVVAATISSGLLDLSINNQLNFDPLAGGGTLEITVTNGPGGAQLGQLTMNGPAESLTPNATTNRTIPIAGDIAATLSVSASVNVPGGGMALIDTSDQLSVTITPTLILVSSVTVNVTDQSVDIDAVDLDVGELDASLTDRIQQGSVILDVVNPFGVGVSGTLSIGPTAKAFSIGAGAVSQVTISYTGDELRSFLGVDNVTFSGSGTITGGGAITVTPGQKMVIKVTVDLTIRIG
ncbi:MAG: hypothetical protein IH968_13470 [Gemmatimonadetes bacterium]|nr:hypothetical protein [Gemmatimonadota bacterium]